MGVVLYIMVTKHYPFKGTTYDQMKIKMWKPHCYIPPKLPVHIASLIKLFTTDPGQRPKVQDIMQYQWLKGSEEFSKPTLFLEPLPNKPNPRIIAAMWGMDYSPKDIGDCLFLNKFDSVMETYLILKYQSPCVENSNHKEKITLPNIAIAPADPTTCHSFLKSIGSEPDNSTSTLPVNSSSQDNKILKKKETKNHSMPSIHCCQQKSQPHSTGVQCGRLQHDHEQIKSNSLQKRSRVSKGQSCGPLQHGQEHLLRIRASKSVYNGPFQHGHEHLLSSRASKSVSCGPVLHVHEYHLCSSLQKTDIVSKNMSCGPVQHNQDEQLLSITLQKRSRVFKSLSCGPAQPNHDEQLLRSGLQKRGRASKSVFCGPVKHDLEQHLDILSEDRITQVEAQDENPHKSSSFLQHTPSSRSAKEGFEDVTTTDAHQDKSLTPQDQTAPVPNPRE